MRYQIVIGLEIHVQLNTESKIFSWEGFEFGAAPNSFVSPITLAHPGALPTVNEKCVHYAIRMGLATHCSIARTTYFDRKNYFYPDLPKGYQLSQSACPICTNGYIPIFLADGREKVVRIHQIHLEEDAGKSIHDRHPTYSLIDLNRAGTGLIEVVSEPDMATSAEAAAYVSEIRRIVRYIGISDADMEKGNLRCDANVSIKLPEAKELGTRVEIKNLNSISFLMKAIDYEVARQAKILDTGGSIRQHTRTWDSNTGKTYAMREKETADDYRYFPEPDLPPLYIKESLIEEIQANLPVLPYERYLTYRALGIEHQEVLTLIEDREFAMYFDSLRAYCSNPKVAANWLLGSVRAWLNEKRCSIGAFPVKADALGAMIGLIEQKVVSHTSAKTHLFPALVQSPTLSALALAKQLDLIMEDDRSELERAMEGLMLQFPKEVKKYRGGKKKLAGFFVGQLMRQFKGKANPKDVNQIVREKLGKR